jgi:hypothetical protein
MQIWKSALFIPFLYGFYCLNNASKPSHTLPKFTTQETKTFDIPDIYQKTPHQDLLQLYTTVIFRRPHPLKRDMHKEFIQHTILTNFIILAY